MTVTTIPPIPGSFLAKISFWPAPAQIRFVEMRTIILNAGRDLGPIGESLIWGEPAWRPMKARQGSTLRISWSPEPAKQLALFVNCRTTLAETMRDRYPVSFAYEGNRALRLGIADPLPVAAIDHLARMTFSYHRPS